MTRNNMLRCRLIKPSFLSGKTEVKKKKVEGIKVAAQKTNLSLKVAITGSMVRCVKKIKDAHTQKIFATIQNLLLTMFAGSLKSTKNPSPAYSKDIKTLTI